MRGSFKERAHIRICKSPNQMLARHHRFEKLNVVSGERIECPRSECRLFYSGADYLAWKRIPDEASGGVMRVPVVRPVLSSSASRSGRKPFTIQVSG
jgi:hypothetical protein